MNLLAQRFAVDEFHCDEVHTFVLANLIDMRDVGMIERGGRFRLANETFHAIAMRSHFSRKNLQRDFTIEPRVSSQPYFAHPARTERGDYLVRAETHTRTNSHCGLHCRSVQTSIRPNR